MRVTLALALAGLSVLAAPYGEAAAKTEYAVITSPDVTIEALTAAELRRMFLLERRFWKAGKPLVVLLPPAGTRSRQFLLGSICKTDEGRYRQLVLEKMYRGEIDLAPKVVDSDEDAVSFVASSRGLVAVVPAASVGSAQVHVVEIADVAPGRRRGN